MVYDKKAVMKWRNAHRDKFNKYKTGWQQTQLEKLEDRDFNAWWRRLRLISPQVFK